jgi:uncharacterized protein
MIQVVWDANDQKTLEREMRALRQAEQELGVSGKLLDCRQYLQRLAASERNSKG